MLYHASARTLSYICGNVCAHFIPYRCVQLQMVASVFILIPCRSIWMQQNQLGVMDYKISFIHYHLIFAYTRHVGKEHYRHCRSSTEPLHYVRKCYSRQFLCRTKSQCPPQVCCHASIFTPLSTAVISQGNVTAMSVCPSSTLPTASG